MKFTSSLLVALSTTAQLAIADCVEGQKEVISSTLTVVYKCDHYRPGETRSGISSNAECAKICEAENRDVCSYHAGTKRCVVGRDDSTDVPREGVAHMTRFVETDTTDPTDPFAEETPEQVKNAKNACLAREAELKAELQQCKSVATAFTDAEVTKCPTRHAKDGFVSGQKYMVYCKKHHAISPPKELHKSTKTLADCAKLCTARTWCKFGVHSLADAECRLSDVGYGLNPGGVTKDWDSVIKM